MVSLDQIKDLESKVQKAVTYIAALKQENVLLQKNLEKYRKRIDELEVLINEYKEDQTAIEEGIKNALLHLDKLEDSIAKPAAGGKSAAAARPGRGAASSGAAAASSGIVAPSGTTASSSGAAAASAISAIEIDDIEGAAVGGGSDSDGSGDDDSGAEDEDGEEPEKAPGELDIF
jgi:TolA-binding protein